MKKIVYFLSLILILVACAAKKPEKRSTFLKGFSTQYNTLFNAKDALNAEFSNRSKAHKDNFYAPYITILTYEEDTPGSDIGQPLNNRNNETRINTNSLTKSNKDKSPGSMQTSFAASNDDPSANAKGATILEISEAKALKAIENFSVIRKGQEKNEKIFEAYITLAKSRIYMGKYLAALDAINTVFSKMKDDKRLPLAKIYQGLTYSKMGDYFKANEIFASVKSLDLKKEYQKILSIHYSESLLNFGKKEEAIAELNHAFDVNTNSELKSRIAFLKGQILASQEKYALARESFQSAYKYSNNFEFEVKSQIEIAKTYNHKDDYSGAKKYIEDISKKGTYASRKNEFLYALGLMANKVGKRDEAHDFFKKSLAEKVSDSQIRGLNYYEIGKIYLEDDEYIKAGAYYDSAITVMTYEPTKVLLKTQSENIKKISKNYYLIKKNDSILMLSKMNEQERIAYFESYIQKIKQKEDAEERERIRAERSKGFDTGDYSANSIFSTNSGTFQDFSTGSKGFYFSNSNAVSRGTTEFKQIWGNRALSDNWRSSSKMATMSNPKNVALGLTSTADPRRFETSFYIEKIPKDRKILEDLKKGRDTASLGIGIMYNDFFSDRELATKTLYELVDNKPEEKVMLQALYEIFAMNYENYPTVSERAKNILLTDYPHTSYAEFARNPLSKNFVKTNPDSEKAYRMAYSYYESEQFEESKKVIENAMNEYKNDALIPKFALLYALVSGKTNGKEVMILQLEQIALNYDKTSEGEKAKSMLNWLKSDLKVEMRDEKGNVMQKNTPAQNVNSKKEAPIVNKPDVKKAEKKELKPNLKGSEENLLAPPTLLFKEKK